MMLRHLACLAIVLISVPEAKAQDDAAYCGQLYALARKYIVGTCGECRPDLGLEGALVDCSKGNYTRGIPYLEKRLGAGHITLPPRS